MGLGYHDKGKKGLTQVRNKTKTSTRLKNLSKEPLDNTSNNQIKLGNNVHAILGV